METYATDSRPPADRSLSRRPGCRTDILMAAALGDLELVRRHLDTDPACIRTRVSEAYFPKENPQSGGTIYIYLLGRGRTPHQIARDFGHEDLFQFLMQRQNSLNSGTRVCQLTDILKLLPKERYLLGERQFDCVSFS
jgi:hypothetical protein